MSGKILLHNYQWRKDSHAEGDMGAHGDNSFLHCVRLKSTIERQTLFATITEQIT
jgi:hypothetical protein